MGLFNNKDDKGCKTCPFLNKDCIEDKCMFWTKLIGEDPQTRQPYDQWSCAIAWLPVMLVENSQMTRQGTSTVQEFRSEVHGAAKMLADESIRRRELEETRLEIDKRLLEHKTQITLGPAQKEEKEEKDA
jgi:hypothetical protein